MNVNNLKEEALKYHNEGKPGKMELIPTKPYNSQKDLSLAYSPGVAYPCLEIKENNDDVYKYTSKGNLVAVISNGTAVLGLGNIGALASKPVMEGKSLLFKIFADIDVFDIEINADSQDDFIKTVKNISPTFGGINLEDIKAPECFEIERRLVEELEIPVMHDDQHGTAIITSAALINAVEISGKKLDKINVVVNGAGASAVACSKLFISLGVRQKNIIMCDTKGVIRSDREDLNETKRFFATKKDVYTLQEALVGADVFLGLSVADILTEDMIRSMAKNPIVFALANPNPEISFEKAMSSRNDIIFATGRSDYPNQVNNVLGFPYIFRGALDVRAKKINEDMKIAAVKAIASLAKTPVPDIVATAYNNNNISFGREYIIPKPFDPRLLSVVSVAVAKAAMNSGVARIDITDWNAYATELNKRIGHENKLVTAIRSKAINSEKHKIVFSESHRINVLKAASTLFTENIAQPILLGNKKEIAELIKNNNIELDPSCILDFRSDEEKDLRKKYAQILFDNLQRRGMTMSEATEMMMNKDYFALMMRYCDDVEACMLGYSSRYTQSLYPVKRVFGYNDADPLASMTILHTKQGYRFLADTNVNPEQTTSDIVETTRLVYKAIKKLGYEPVIALLSYSNFGKCNDPEAQKMAKAVATLHFENPEIAVDGEMQVNYALNVQKRMEKFPFNKLGNKVVNTFIFPNLAAGNIAYKLISEGGKFEILGPTLLGGPKGVQLYQDDMASENLVNMSAFASVDVTCENNETCLSY